VQVLPFITIVNCCEIYHSKSVVEGMNMCEVGCNVSSQTVRERRLYGLKYNKNAFYER
jgi:hypothetical protein